MVREYHRRFSLRYVPYAARIENFPPNDPLAAKVARLCILREDFLLEMSGVYTEEIKQLDGHSEEWRKLYFIRNLVRTLREIESGIHTLMSDPQFKVLLAAQKPERQKEFAEHGGFQTGYFTLSRSHVYINSRCSFEPILLELV
jgi:hypothetical protein